MFHQFPCGLTTQESVVDQIADFFTLTGMHEAVDAAVPCCAAQGAGCENAKFPFVGKLEPQPNSSWRITSAAKELLPLLRGANAMWMQGVLGRLWMVLEILNICRLMISLIRTADFVEKIQSKLRLCEEDGHQNAVPIQIFNALPFVLRNSWHNFEFHSVSLILFRSMQGFKSVWNCHIETVALFNCDCLALGCFCKSELFHPCTDESWHVHHPHTAGLLHHVAEQQRLKAEAKAETAKVETTGTAGCKAVYGSFDYVNVIDRLQLLCCDTNFRSFTYVKC